MATKTRTKAVWANRIVGDDVVPAASLLANPENWRLHPEPQAQSLSGVLERVGWVQKVLVNRRSSPEWGERQNLETMVDGHLRVKLALQQGPETPVPRTVVDLSPEEEALVLATLDPISAMAQADPGLLESLLDQTRATIDEMTSAGNDALGRMLADLGKRNGVRMPETDGGAAAPAQTAPEQYVIMVTCQNEDEQTRLLEQFIAEGLQCRALIA